MQGNELEHPMSEFEALRNAWAHLRASAAMRWIVLVKFVFGVTVLFNLYWTPFLLAKVTQVELSYVWIPMYGALVLSGWVLSRVNPKKGREDSWLILGLLVTAILLLGFSLNEPLGMILSLLILHELGRGTINPLMTAYVDHRIRPEFRVTFQSLTSFIGAFGDLLALGVVAIVLAGTKPDPGVIPIIWAVGGAVFFIAILVLWFYRPNGKNNTRTS